MGTQRATPCKNQEYISVLPLRRGGDNFNEEAIVPIVRQCAVPSCGAATAGHSTLCERHKRTQRRHGHPEQLGITVHDLKPYRLRVAARQAKNPNNPAWPLLQQRWQSLVDSSTETIAAYLKGVVSVGYVVRAAEQVQRVALAVLPAVVVETTLAMYLLREERPNRFRTDRAFSFELARRVRGLTESNAGTYWDAQTGKMKRVYKDLTPKAMEVLAGQLAVAFGGAGLFIAGLERAEQDKARANQQDLSKALGELI